MYLYLSLVEVSRKHTNRADIHARRHHRTFRRLAGGFAGVRKR